MGGGEHKEREREGEGEREELVSANAPQRDCTLIMR